MTWQDVFDKLFSIPEMVIDRLRVNVIIVAVLVTWVIIDFGDKLIHLLDVKKVDPELIVTVLVGLIGTGVGGLIAAMIRMFESPQVPAEVVTHIVDRLLERLGVKKDS